MRGKRSDKGDENGERRTGNGERGNGNVAVRRKVREEEGKKENSSTAQLVLIEILVKE